MLTSSFSRRLFSVLVLIIAVLPGCRKKIDFEQGENSYNTGAINPGQPILEEWESIGSTWLGASHIASDGQNLFYSKFSGGVNRMYIMDTLGNYSVLFDISSNDDVQLIEYVGSKLYFTQRESNGVGKIHEFDENGILNTYELLVSASYGTHLTSLMDVGSQLFVAGKFRFGNNGSSWSACLIDKATGAVTQMPGLGGNPINSVTYFNNEIHVAARGVFGTFSNGGRAVAKWNGSQWVGLGPHNLNYNYIGALVGSCVGHYNGELFVGGRFDYGYTTVKKYSEVYNNFIDNQGFNGTCSDVEYPNMYMRMFGNDLYLFGELRFWNASFNSVYVMENGVWRSIGALDGVATDLAICQGYAFALVDGNIKKYSL